MASSLRPMRTASEAPAMSQRPISGFAPGGKRVMPMAQPARGMTPLRPSSTFVARRQPRRRPPARAAAKATAPHAGNRSTRARSSCASAGEPLLPGRNRRKSLGLLRNRCKNWPLNSNPWLLNQGMKNADTNKTPPTSATTRANDRLGWAGCAGAAVSSPGSAMGHTVTTRPTTSRRRRRRRQTSAGKRQNRCPAGSTITRTCSCGW